MSNIDNLQPRDTPLAEIAALVGVVALVVSVTYSHASYDGWDALVGLVSGFFGLIYWVSLFKGRPYWGATYVVFAGFLVAILFFGGVLSMLLGIFELDGDRWEYVGPAVLVALGAINGVAVYLVNRKKRAKSDDSSEVSATAAISAEGRSH